MDRPGADGDKFQDGHGPHKLSSGSEPQPVQMSR